MVKQNNKLNLISNKYLLYIVFILNILFFGYIVNKNNHATIIIFLLTGGLLRCYTGNMLVVLSIALFVSVLYCFSRQYQYPLYEGFADGTATAATTTTVAVPATTEVQQVAVPATSEVQQVVVPATTEVQQVAVPATTEVQQVAVPATTEVQQVAVPATQTVLVQPTTEQFGSRKPKGSISSKINYAETVDEAYSNLDKLIGNGGIEKLTSQTNDLLQHQGKLVNTMKTLSPLMDQVNSLISSFESVSPLKPKSFVNA
jgi:hypothetical protein